MHIQDRDEKIVKRCLAGDERAWVELWERYGGLVKGVARRTGCSTDEAKDVLQQVALVALEKMAEVRDPAKISAWLAGVARYKGLALVRKRSPGDEALLIGLEHGGQVDEDIERDQQLAILRASYVRLDERCQRLLQALELDDPPRSYEDIAAEVDLATSSIGPIRRRCLNSLRKIFVCLSRSGEIDHYPTRGS